MADDSPQNPDDVTSQELVLIQEERETLPAPASVLPSSREWEATMAVAREIAGTQFVPESYRGRPDAVVAAILTGREMGIGPMQALRQIHMIDGRPAFAADLMLAKMRAGGLVIVESSVNDQRAYIKARRRDTGEEAEAEWTLADAEKAGLSGKKNWKTYPADMLWARCVGRIARRLGSDLLGGLVYAAEEMQDWDDGGGYGGGDGYEATTARVFDPETDLMPGAYRAPDAPKVLRAALDEFDPTVDWSQIVADVCGSLYSSDHVRELEPDEYRDLWRRLANAVQWIREHVPPGDFPPVSKETIQEAFAFAFGGYEVTVEYKEVEQPELLTPEQQSLAESVADVPFGEQEEE